MHLVMYQEQEQKAVVFREGIVQLHRYNESRAEN